MKRTKSFLCAGGASLILALSVGAYVAHAQQGVLMSDTEETLSGVVTKIVSEGKVQNPGLPISSWHQALEVRISKGDHQGDVISIDNDYVKLQAGDKVFIKHIVRAEDKKDMYSIADPDRLSVLAVIAGIFILCVLIFGGMQGVRALVSLAGSLALIVYGLLPNILAGHSPVIASLVAASLIIVVGSFITHGFRKSTLSAVIGMILTVALTGLMAQFATTLARFSGFTTDETVYLNSSTQGGIDLVGLVFASIMIGLLGVLYDMAIGQAVAVEELHHVAPHVPRRAIYRRAIRLGREHIGALVNTLAIAYVGASLPLLLMFYNSNAPVLLSLNREIFSVEILRTLIGSIGIVLAVPITTLVAVWLVVKKSTGDGVPPVSAAEAELSALEKYEHHH